MVFLFCKIYLFLSEYTYIFVLSRFDGQLFVRDLEQSIEIREHQSKEPRQIRYIHYAKLAVDLRRKNIGSKEVDNPIYTFPKVILNFLRAKVPGNVVGELRKTLMRSKQKNFARLQIYQDFNCVNRIFISYFSMNYNIPADSYLFKVNM